MSSTSTTGAISPSYSGYTMSPGIRSFLLGASICSRSTPLTRRHHVVLGSPLASALAVELLLLRAAVAVAARVETHPTGNAPPIAAAIAKNLAARINPYKRGGLRRSSCLASPDA
jgi:hypothetical protein